MTIKDICVSIGLAKELKNCGFPQEYALFCWNLNKATGEYSFDNTHYDSDWSIAAPTSSEITELLPKLYAVHQTLHGKKDERFCCFNSHTHNHYERGLTEADARARMWLYLQRENKKDHKMYFSKLVGSERLYTCLACGAEILAGSKKSATTSHYLMLEKV